MDVMGGGGLKVGALASGSRGPVTSPGGVPMPLSTQVYKWVPANLS